MDADDFHSFPSSSTERDSRQPLKHRIKVVEERTQLRKVKKKTYEANTEFPLPLSDSGSECNKWTENTLE